MREKTLSVSIHDVSPRYKTEIMGLVSELKKIGVKKFNFLCVADWEGSQEFLLSKHQDFLNFLKHEVKDGSEIVMHGCEHKPPKDNDSRYETIYDKVVGKYIAGDMAEFQNLTYDEAKDRIMRAKEQFDNAGLDVRGMVYPWWQGNEETRRAVKDAGLEYLVAATAREILLKRRVPIENLKTGEIDNSYEISYEPAGKPGWFDDIASYYTIINSLTFCLMHRTDPVIRMAYHPEDYNNKTLLKSQHNMTRRLLRGRVQKVYRQILGL